MKRFARWLVFGCLIALLSPLIVVAQTSPEGQSAQELRRQLDELRAQMAAQTKLMNAIQTRLDTLEQAKQAAAPAQPPAQTAAAAEPTGPPPAQPSGHVGAGTSSYQTFSQDQVAAPRIDNAPLDPKYPGFFRIPGSQTFLKIGGYFKTDVIYDGKPAGDAERFIPSSIPSGVPGVNNTTVSIRPTRLNLDFRAPVAALGDVRFYVEGDMFGSSSTTPRLRHAYTQVKNILIGQTFSNFQDPDAGPDQLDFQGPNSQVSIRNPQLRYSLKLADKTSFSMAVEKASSDVAFKTPEFSSLPNSPAPDGTLKLRQETEGGHIQIAGLFRGVAAYLPNGKSDTVFGWGVMVAGSQRVVNKDTLTYQGAYGAGMQRYFNDTSGLGIDAAIVSNQQPWLRALPMVGTYFGYQHWWAPKVRSSVIYGFDQVNNTAYQPGSTFHKSNYTAGNIIWNVFGSLNVGTEFLYGWVVKKDNSTVNAPRIMFSAKYDLNFVKKN
jgi:hypothetical protein